VEFIRELFSKNFMPHGMCYLWDPAVLWLNVISDGLITVAYYAIPFILFYLVRKRRDLVFQSIFLAFGVFILACGTTHLMAVITVWTPVYRLDGLIKAITAAASVVTLLMLLPLLPTLVALPSPARLEREIQVRHAAEAEIRTINLELEARVASRTAERHSLEDQLMQSQKMEAIGRLAGGVAHDFNNLLTVILGYNEMLRDRVAQDQMGVEYSDEILHAAGRASALTNQLLAFSRRQVAMPRVVDLNEVVRQIERMLRRLIGEDVELATQLAPGVALVNADPTHLDQIIMNLAVNSRDAMPSGGKLTIETSETDLDAEYAGRHIGVPPGRYTMLAISDTGSGMDTDTLAHLFEPFYTTKELGKGTGLGLSIVYGIVKQNGGEIIVYSEPGAGTAIKIYFPKASGSVDPVAAPRQLPSPTHADATILVVEDEEQVRMLTHTVLTRVGYRVLEATSASEAIRLLTEYQGAIDLLLTDVVMPEMRGMELASRAEAVRPGLPVLFMSGYTDAGVIHQGALDSAMPFIQKPFTAASLYQKVREVLSRE
jgi:signal transduction histidine kinase